MPFSAGTFSLYTPGNPVVTGTTIASSWANNTLNDIATGLSTAVLKDGTQTITANIPMSGFRITGLGTATARTDAITAAQVQDSTTLFAAGAAGTNTVTVSCTPTVTAYVTGQRFFFRPANTNTGATTVNVNSVGAANIFSGGAACVGGEIVQNVPVVVGYDGTQFNILGYLTAAGVIDLSLGSLVGIKFDSTQNASADANTLDDYAEVTHTTNINGYAADPSIDAKITKVGRLITIVIPTFTGTSDSTGKTFATAIAAAYRPATNHEFCITAIDNGGTAVIGVGRVSTAGAVSFFPTPAAGNWTGSGTATVSQCSTSWIV